MTPIQFTEGTYSEIVDGWTITASDWTKTVEFVKNERDGQAVTIDDAGDFSVEVSSSEKGHGYFGDSASTRYIPITVAIAAIRIWQARQVTP